MPSHNNDYFAQALIESIKLELPNASYFTREDLLHLSVFAHVTTITRYRYVCVAVRYAIERKWMMEMNRTDLILTGGKRVYANAIVNIDEYESTVAKIVNKLPHEPFGVMTVVSQWTTDPHLTPNAKRTYTRGILNRMLVRQYIEPAGAFMYIRRGG